jgi:hypothetical protein
MMSKKKNNTDKLAFSTTHNLDVKYNYVSINYEKLGRKVLELKKQYPNNQEFGNEISKYIMNNKGCPTFPGIQNL